jgi:hypothetical protein
MSENKIVGVVFGGKFGRVTPGSIDIVWDQLSHTSDCDVEVTQPDERYMLRFVAANRIICFLGKPDVVIAGVDPRCFETRASDARGASESPLIGTWSNGMTSAQVEYIDAPSNRHWFSCALTLVDA